MDDFANVQDSLSLPHASTDLANNRQIRGSHASSVQSESQDTFRNQIRTLCVWCGIEFNYDLVDSEIQSDSVGFMCLACKAKISGQINVLDSGSTLNADHL